MKGISPLSLACIAAHIADIIHLSFCSAKLHSKPANYPRHDHSIGRFTSCEEEILSKDNMHVCVHVRVHCVCMCMCVHVSEE